MLTMQEFYNQAIVTQNLKVVPSFLFLITRVSLENIQKMKNDLIWDVWHTVTN